MPHRLNRCMTGRYREHRRVESAMNGAAAHPLGARPMMPPAPPHGPGSEGALPTQSVFRGQAKGRSLVSGLSVKIAHATIDAFFVLMSGVSIFWLRFGAAYAGFDLFASLFGRTHLS